MTRTIKITEMTGRTAWVEQDYWGDTDGWDE